MKVKQIIAVYFSPTGTTERVTLAVADRIAKELSLPLLQMDITLPETRKGPFQIPEDSVLVIGFPVYAGRLPNLLLPYISTIQGKDSIAIPVVVFGNRSYDDALIELRNILDNAGIKSLAAGAFVGEHAFSRLLAKGRPGADDLKLANELGFRAAEKLAAGQRVDTSIGVAGNNPPGPYYQPRDRNGNMIDIRKVKPKTSDTCTDCKLCAKLCPMGAIDTEHIAEVPGVCIKCCACVKKCPIGAKYFDDPGFLYHQHELEDMYARPAENSLFF